jgi:hypothetical protein
MDYMESDRNITIEHRLTLVEAISREHDREISDIKDVLKGVADTLLEQSVSHGKIWQIIKSIVWVVGTASTAGISYILSQVLPKIF